MLGKFGSMSATEPEIDAQPNQQLRRSPVVQNTSDGRCLRPVDDPATQHDHRRGPATRLLRRCATTADRRRRTSEHYAREPYCRLNYSCQNTDLGLKTLIVYILLCLFLFIYLFISEIKHVFVLE